MQLVPRHKQQPRYSKYVPGSSNAPVCHYRGALLLLPCTLNQKQQATRTVTVTVRQKNTRNLFCIFFFSDGEKQNTNKISSVRPHISQKTYTHEVRTVYHDYTMIAYTTTYAATETYTTSPFFQKQHCTRSNHSSFCTPSLPRVLPRNTDARYMCQRIWSITPKHTCLCIFFHRFMALSRSTVRYSECRTCCVQHQHTTSTHTHVHISLSHNHPFAGRSQSPPPRPKISCVDFVIHTKEKKAAIIN